MGLTPEYIEGQTPLDDDEQEGLLITTITTRGELDEFEQLNIEEAIIWSLWRSFKLEDVFTESLIKTLHIKCMVMFGNGQENLENQIKILVWTNLKSQLN